MQSYCVEQKYHNRKLAIDEYYTNNCIHEVEFCTERYLSYLWKEMALNYERSSMEEDIKIIPIVQRW